MKTTLICFDSRKQKHTHTQITRFYTVNVNRVPPQVTAFDRTSSPESALYSLLKLTDHGTIYRKTIKFYIAA